MSKIALNYNHDTVLLHEAVAILNPTPGKTFVDCTLGGGGHTAALLKAVGPSGKVFAFDRDLDAIKNAGNRFSHEIASGQLELNHCVFSQIFPIIKSLGYVGKIDGVLADIGVSSHHLDVADRGFSFMKDGPLDMRMDQTRGECVSDFLATASEADIADVIYNFGEEPKARFIAKIICERRIKEPLKTTHALAELIASKVFWKKESRKHPATRTFQALRIYVNRELSELEALLKDGCRVLRVGGVLAIITFHSLEDRLVKSTMQKLAGKSADTRLPRDVVLTNEQLSTLSQCFAELLQPFPGAPSEDEIEKNPRARSAKLRAIRLTKECL